MLSPDNGNNQPDQPEPDLNPGDIGKAWVSLFVDIGEGDWFYNAVKHVHQVGLYKGTSDTTFSPNAPMTRTMFATVLYRAMRNENALTEYENGNDNQAFLIDFAVDTWYYDAVQCAAKSGVVQGVGNCRFVSESPVTREQTAVMLWNYIQYKPAR